MESVHKGVYEMETSGTRGSHFPVLANGPEQTAGPRDPVVRPREVPGLGELLSTSSDTEEPTLERFGNFGEIGKLQTACTLVLCGIEICATERVYDS
jgi:hypothetical protein